MRQCNSDTDCDDSIFCNGLEVCVEGFCEKLANSIPCPDQGIECESNVCDETTKSCKLSPMPDGSFCGIPENACIGGKHCLSGKCTDINITDCSHLDSECSKGSCDPESGECLRIPEKEGEPCNSGKICVKDEVCTQGFCEGEAPDMPEAAECNKTECTESNGFFEVSDPSQNWNDCTTSDGREGYCDYGICTAKKQQKKESSSSSGCSVVIF